MKPRMIGLPGKATKPKPPKWVNNKIIFGKCKRFEDYKKGT